MTRDNVASAKPESRVTVSPGEAFESRLVWPGTVIVRLSLRL